MNTFPERLRAAMTAAGMNQNALAQAAGISRGAVSGYMNGKLTPGPDRLKALADATGVTADDLLSSESYPMPIFKKNITLAMAARCLRMAPSTVKAGMLDGSLPIGRVISMRGRRDVILITPDKLRNEAGAARFQECFGG